MTGGSSGIGAAIVARLLAEDIGVVSLDRQPPAITHPSLGRSVEVDLLDPAATDRSRARGGRSRCHHPFRPQCRDQSDRLAAPCRSRRSGGLTQLHLGCAITLAQARAAGDGARGVRADRPRLSSARCLARRRARLFRDEGGLIGLARTWALELARKGITVNVVAPGPTRSAMFHDVLPEGDPRIAQLAASIRRAGSASPRTSPCRDVFRLRGRRLRHGQTLYVCGGLSVGTASA